MKFPPGTGKSWSWTCPAGIWFRHILKRKAHSIELQRSTGLAAWFGSRQLKHLISPPSQHSQGSFYCITHSAKNISIKKKEEDTLMSFPSPKLTVLPQQQSTEPFLPSKRGGGGASKGEATAPWPPGPPHPGAPITAGDPIPLTSQASPANPGCDASQSIQNTSRCLH